MAIYVNFEGMDNARVELAGINDKFVEKVSELKTTVQETTNHDWQGNDADAFVNNTNKKLSQVSLEYNEYMKALEDEIDFNQQKFRDVQNRNVNMIEDD